MIFSKFTSFLVNLGESLIFLELNFNILGFGGHGSVSGSFSSKAYENSTNGATAASSLGYSGGPSSSKGLSFKEVLATLVLITRGTHEEKIKCEFFAPNLGRAIELGGKPWYVSIAKIDVLFSSHIRPTSMREWSLYRKRRCTPYYY